MEEKIEHLSKAMEELTGEIRKLRAQLLETPDMNYLTPPEFGWRGLALETTEILADSTSKLSSRGITEEINQRREERGFHERTRSASVARALSDLVSKGLVTRMKAGRETFYALNPAKVIAVAGRGEDPREVIDKVFDEIKDLPEKEKEKNVAVWYSLHGPEEAPQEMKAKTDVADTKELCRLYGMPRPPEEKIKLAGIQGISLSPVETRLCIFLLR